MEILSFFILWIIYRWMTESKAASNQRITYRSVRDRLDLDVRVHASDAEPLFPQVKAAVARHPAQPINHFALPLLPTGDGDFYHPGVCDIVRPDVPAVDDRWQRVIAAILATHHNKLTDWRVLEHNIRTVPFIEQVDAVLRNLEHDRVVFNVRSVFMDLVRHSADYNAVKWGLYHVVRHILADPDLWEDPRTRRDVVGCAVKNGGVALLPIAVEISTCADFNALVAEGMNDQSLGMDLMTVLASLSANERAVAMLADMDQGEEIIRQHLALIASLPHGIETLGALRGIFFTMLNDLLEWEGREALRDRANSLLLGRLARETLIDAIRTDNHRETALLLVMEGRMEEMIPIVLNEFRREPSPLVIDVLGTIGTPEHINERWTQLPDPDELAARGELSSATPMTAELYERSRLYAAVVRQIGKLGTPAAIAQIHTAARDFFPEVRASAMVAMQSLLPWTLDADGKALVLACLGDTDEFVREAAEATAAYHMLHASVNRLWKGEVNVAMN